MYQIHTGHLRERQFHIYQWGVGGGALQKITREANFFLSIPENFFFKNNLFMCDFIKQWTETNLFFYKISEVNYFQLILLPLPPSQ